MNWANLAFYPVGLLPVVLFLVVLLYMDSYKLVRLRSSTVGCSAGPAWNWSIIRVTLRRWSRRPSKGW